MNRIDFNSGWRFKTPDREWKEITLPHDAQLFDKRDPKSQGSSDHGYFVGNVYEYEKCFTAPVDWKEKCVEVLFEGVYKNTTVCLNGVEIGSHKYGYTQFVINLGEHLKYGEENVLSLTADNSKLPNSRWYSGGGIYRPVSLLLSNKAHIEFQGVKITTVSISPAVINVKTTATEGTVSVEIRKDGQVVATGIGKDCNIEIPNAKLWSDESPQLYEAFVTLTKGGEVIDEEASPFGIREITYSPQGLFINGKNTLLRGGCVHHDHGVIGAASFKESEFRRVRILKEQGFNAIRVSHNPASTAMLEACDYYGMYVMDETFDMWYVRKTKFDYGCDFMECWKKDVSAMVERDFNHPSVIMYSIGNEVSEPGKPEGIEQGKEIIAYIKSLDCTRAVTGGMNLMLMVRYAGDKGQYDNVDQEKSNSGQTEGKETKNASLIFNTMASFIGSGMNKAANSDKADKITSPILDELDIAGYNYCNGRYAMEGTKHPDRIIVGSETFPYEIGKNWDMVEKYPYLIGDFMWTAWDYLGEAGLGAWSYTGGMPFNRPYPWKLSGSGVIDILGNPDASIGLAQVVWNITDKPVIGVRPVNHPGVRVSKSVWRGTNAIPSWSWKKCEGNKAEIDVYARADSVELFVNEKSVGKKKINGYQAHFKTKYHAGNICAVAYDKSGKEISRSKLSSATDASVVIKPEKDSLLQGEIAYININIEDKNGIVECNDDRLLSVNVEGGELLGFGSANPCTEEDFVAGSYTTYMGRAQAIVRIISDESIKVVVTDGNTKIEKTIDVH